MKNAKKHTMQKNTSAADTWQPLESDTTAFAAGFREWASHFPKAFRDQAVPQMFHLASVAAKFELDLDVEQAERRVPGIRHVFSALSGLRPLDFLACYECLSGRIERYHEMTRTRRDDLGEFVLELSERLRSERLMAAR